MSGARRVHAPAKINLTLHVTGRRADGYHLLDSLVAFADVGDVIEVGEGDGFSVTGPFAEGVAADATNLVLRALALTDERRQITLHKYLPHPAGIGGGSSDAAALLRVLDATPGMDALLSLGADVPVCMAARAARMRGIGEEVAPVDLPGLHGVLINPGVAVPTGAVFQALQNVANAPMGDLPERQDGTAFTRWLAAGRNDLEAPARAIAPVIGDVLLALRQAGAGLARMSGSGATCFGLWPSRAEAEAAADRIADAHLEWWVRACSLR